MQEEKRQIRDSELKSSDEIQLIITKHDTDIKTNKTTIKDIDLVYQQSNIDSMSLYVSINKTYMQGLISNQINTVPQLDSLKLSEFPKRLIYKNHLQGDYFNFEFHIFSQKSTITFQIAMNLSQTEKKICNYFWKLYYYDTYAWKVLYERDQTKFMDVQNKIQWEIPDFDSHLESNVFLQVHIGYSNENSESNLFNGLINVGNVCYMNSFLQTLYYIKSIRKFIAETEFKDNQRFGTNLQKVFLNLMNNRDKAVNPTPIIHVGPWSEGFEYVQEDIHEFKMAFFDELEKLNPQFTQLFKIQICSEVYCKEVDYRNKTVSNINEIDLFLNANKKILKNVQASLKYLTEEQALDGKIDAEPHGMQEGFKKLSIIKLPKILFFNLQRYQYDEHGLHKLFSKFQYDQTINLSDLLSDRSPADYTLYAAIIHSGKTAHSGHYYTYINVSTDYAESNWYLFNDEFVQKAEEYEVFKNNFGGMENSYHFDKKAGQFEKVIDKKKSTAYILVYINKAYFNDIQNISEIQIPKKVINKISVEKLKQKNEKLFQVHVLTLDDIKKKACSFFDVQKISSEGTLFNIQHLDTLSNNIQSMGRTVLQNYKQGSFSAWKIGSDKTVTNLKREYNNNFIDIQHILLGFQKKHSPDFYILIIPNNIHNPNRYSDEQFLSLNNSNSLGLVIKYLSWIDKNDEYISSIESVKVVEKRQFKINDMIDADYEHFSVFDLGGKVQDTDRFSMTNIRMFVQFVFSYISIKEEFYDAQISASTEQTFNEQQENPKLKYFCTND